MAPDDDSGDAWLVAGLGNPGPSYAGHRHNVGFLVADVLAERTGGKFRAHKGRASVLEGRLGGTRTVLVKPQGYMNDSGGPVSAVCRFFGVPTSRLIVVHDELDLPYGTLRLKRGGGDNGHNGLRSLRTSLGTGDYLRVRFGIDRPPGRMDPADYVLRDFSVAERRDLEFHVDRAADAVEALIVEGLEAAQNRFHADLP